MRALFTLWGARVAGGEDADAALLALGTDSVDLIVADLRLADGASGIDAIARLRGATGAATPALVVSGDTSQTARAEARSAGVTLLSKPVVATALKAAAETALAAGAGADTALRTAVAVNELVRGGVLPL
jgi:DNA-binding response OmpR family regulator